MSIINSLDDALDFYPVAGHRPLLVRLGGALRLYWDALGDALAAARSYHELTRRGVPHDVAVRQVFNEHFDA